jgi:hypothetical protein
MTFVTVFISCLIIGAVYEYFKGKRKVVTVAQPTIRETQWIDYGPTVDILGRTFIKDDIDYVYKGLYYAHSVNGGPIFGVLPGIALTKKEFFETLETL